MHHKVINAKLLVPQNRERVYIVCFLAEKVKNSDDFEWPNYDLLEPRKITVQDILESLDKESAEPYTLTQQQWNKVKGKGPQNNTPQLVDLNGVAKCLIASYRRNWSLQTEFVAQPDHPEGLPRFFTPLECMRLQGFPETMMTDNRNTNRIYH